MAYIANKDWKSSEKLEEKNCNLWEYHEMAPLLGIENFVIIRLGIKNFVKFLLIKYFWKLSNYWKSVMSWKVKWFQQSHLERRLAISDSTLTEIDTIKLIISTFVEFFISKLCEKYIFLILDFFNLLSKRISAVIFEERFWTPNSNLTAPNYCVGCCEVKFCQI